ncbi:MAG TPA: 4-hydroxyproline epimerase, partial [Phnomibacter sp.]|nr:4-hydroxyproline epimerase [Phnomibacter sp.]
ETSGCLPMCGHGTIGTITIAIEEGLIIPKTPGQVRMETPAGLVEVSYGLAEGSQANKPKVAWVQLTNVPSFLHSTGLQVPCPGLGNLVVDVAYGGNFYAIVEVQPGFAGLQHFTASQLIAMAGPMRQYLNQHYQFVHPHNPTIQGCSHILFTGATLSPQATARNAVFYGDKAIDRSPCGTGTSARMAQWYAQGRLKPGEPFVHESIIGSQFVGTIVQETTVNGLPAIRPAIKGWAKVYGYNTITIDTEDDPYAFGFQVI